MPIQSQLFVFRFAFFSGVHQKDVGWIFGPTEPKIPACVFTENEVVLF